MHTWTLCLLISGAYSVAKAKQRTASSWRFLTVVENSVFQVYGDVSQYSETARCVGDCALETVTIEPIPRGSDEDIDLSMVQVAVSERRSGARHRAHLPNIFPGIQAMLSDVEQDEVQAGG